MASSSSSTMLAIQEKKTTPTDLFLPLRHYIAHTYSEREAADNEEDLELIQQMRREIERPTDSLDARRDLLQRYFRSLCVIEPRFPISEEKDQICTVSFAWFDAFKSSKKCSQHSVHFEKACVLFNLGAVYSQLGLNSDRTDPNGIKQSCSFFQASAGAFAFLKENLSMKASSSSSTATMDISVECANMLEKLMLAQAQECFYEKVVLDQKPPSLCAKIARQVSLYYEEAHASLTLPPLNQYIDRGWVSHIMLKASQFHGEACYRVAIDLHEKENIGEEIARLKVGAASLANAKKAAKGVVASLLDAVSKLETSINANLERATRENDRVYLMKIPSVTTLGPLPSASLVKPTNMAEALDASKEKMFTRLVPDTSMKALSRYTELLDEIIRTQVEKLQQESEIARVKLKEMHLPESLHALEGCDPIPEHVRSEIESIQLDGGLKGLDASTMQLQDLRRVNEELLVQTEEILQRESQEDSKLRSQFGSRWKRQPSSSLTKGFQERLSSFAVKLKQAADVDGRIARMIQDNRTFLSILDVKPIEASLPTLKKPILSFDGDEDAIVGTLKQSLAHLEALGAQRAGLEDAMKEMKQKDNILPKLLSTFGSQEDLFKRELAKYDPICLEVSKNIELQQKLLQQIMVQNNSFVAIFNVEDYKVARDQALKQLSSAVAKYHEIRDSIHNAGIQFYLSLQDAINALKQQCSDYANTRETENRDTIESLQRQLAGFSFQESRHSSNLYPSVSSQPQRPAPPPTSSQSFYGSSSSTPPYAPTQLLQPSSTSPPVGYQSTNQTGYQGTNQAGYQDANQTGYQGTNQAGYQGTNQAGYQGTNQAGYQGTNQLGYQSNATNPAVGYQSTNSVGYHQSMLPPPQAPPYHSTSQGLNQAPPRPSYYAAPYQQMGSNSYNYRQPSQPQQLPPSQPHPSWPAPQAAYYNVPGAPTNQQPPPPPQHTLPPPGHYYQPPPNEYYR